MLNLSVSQAQRQFTSILSEVTTVIDRKSNVKKAVILPYSIYEKLIAKQTISESSDVSKFVGLLSQDFESDDPRYSAIIK